jgi:hypothetical protein
MAAALSRVYAGLCRRDRLTSKKCPFWLDSLFCVITLTAKMAARLKTIVAIAMLALYDEYDEFDTYWQNGGYKKISDIIFAECHIFTVNSMSFIYLE